MKLPRWLIYWGDAVLVPLALVAVYGVFVITADATGVAQVLAAVFLTVVLGLWFAFRRLRVHAVAARLAAIGEPTELLALADQELARRWLRGGDGALHLYRALAHNLAGRPAEARAALDASGIKSDGAGAGGLRLLWASAEIDTRTRQGDAAAARAVFDRVVARHPRTVGAGGLDVLIAECEARILLAEGDPAGARALVTPHVKDIRLGPAARAQLHALLAACARADGDAEAAAAATAKAAALAPACAFGP